MLLLHTSNRSGSHWLLSILVYIQLSLWIPYRSTTSTHAALPYIDTGDKRYVEPGLQTNNILSQLLQNADFKQWYQEHQHELGKKSADSTGNDDQDDDGKRGYPIIKKGYPIIKRGYPILKRGYPMLKRGYPILKRPFEGIPISDFVDGGRSERDIDARQLIEVTKEYVRDHAQVDGSNPECEEERMFDVDTTSEGWMVKLEETVRKCVRVIIDDGPLLLPPPQDTMEAGEAAGGAGGDGSGLNEVHGVSAESDGGADRGVLGKGKSSSESGATDGRGVTRRNPELGDSFID